MNMLMVWIETNYWFEI